jgi:hypothetical protein
MHGEETVVVDMSERETQEHSPIRADDQVGVESARRDEPAVEVFRPRTAERPAHSLCGECLDDRRELPSSSG